jgi:hypothetical protein
MTGFVIAIDLLFSLVCWLIAFQLIRLHPQVVAVADLLDSMQVNGTGLALVPDLLADRRQSILQLQQLYQSRLGLFFRLWQLLGQTLRLLLWVRTRR